MKQLLFTLFCLFTYQMVCRHRLYPDELYGVVHGMPIRKETIGWLSL